MTLASSVLFSELEPGDCFFDSGKIWVRIPVDHKDYNAAEYHPIISAAADTHMVPMTDVPTKKFAMTDRVLRDYTKPRVKFDFY